MTEQHKGPYTHRDQPCTASRGCWPSPSPTARPFAAMRVPAGQFPCRRGDQPRHTRDRQRERQYRSHRAPRGTYAIRIAFDDGHDTGDLLLGRRCTTSASTRRSTGRPTSNVSPAGLTARAIGSPRQMRRSAGSACCSPIRPTGCTKESGRTRTPPESVETVEQLLAWLRPRGGDRGYLFDDANVRVTVNWQFAEPFTRLDPGDEGGDCAKLAEPSAADATEALHRR